MQNLSRQRGQSLVEVIVALGIAVVIVLAFTSAAINSARNAQFAKNQNQATRMSQRTLELVRAARDQDSDIDSTAGANDSIRWSDLFSLDFTSTRCYTLDEDTLEMTEINCASPGAQEAVYSKAGDETQTVFRRKIEITDNIATNPSAQKKQILVTISWDDGKGTHTSEANTLLTQWQ